MATLVKWQEQACQSLAALHTLLTDTLLINLVHKTSAWLLLLLCLFASSCSHVHGNAYSVLRPMQSAGSVL